MSEYLNEFRARLDAAVERSKSKGYVERTWFSRDPQRYRADLNDTPTYISWRSMRERCTNPRHVRYENYGGANPPVVVCERWESFEHFLSDMGPRPAGTTLSRFADSGNYEPGNCAWHTTAQQAAEHRKKLLPLGPINSAPAFAVFDAVAA